MQNSRCERCTWKSIFPQTMSFPAWRQPCWWFMGSFHRQTVHIKAHILILKKDKCSLLVTCFYILLFSLAVTQRSFRKEQSRQFYLKLHTYRPSSLPLLLLSLCYFYSTHYFVTHCTWITYYAYCLPFPWNASAVSTKNSCVICALLYM